MRDESASELVLGAFCAHLISGRGIQEALCLARISSASWEYRWDTLSVLEQVADGVGHQGPDLLTPTLPRLMIITRGPTLRKRSRSL